MRATKNSQGQRDTQRGQAAEEQLEDQPTDDQAAAESESKADYQANERLTSYESSKLTERTRWNETTARNSLKHFEAGIATRDDTLNMSNKVNLAINQTARQMGLTGQSSVFDYGGALYADLEKCVDGRTTSLNYRRQGTPPRQNDDAPRLVHEEDEEELLNSYDQALLQVDDTLARMTKEKQRSAEHYRANLDLVVQLLLYIADNTSAMKGNDKALLWADEARNVIATPPEHFNWMRLTADVIIFNFDLRRNKLVADFVRLFQVNATASNLDMIGKLVRFTIVPGESLDHCRRRFLAVTDDFEQRVRTHPLAEQYGVVLRTVSPHVVIEQIMARYSGHGLPVVHQATDLMRAKLQACPDLDYSILLNDMAELVNNNPTVVVANRKLFDSAGRAELAAVARHQHERQANWADKEKNVDGGAKKHITKNPGGTNKTMTKTDLYKKVEERKSLMSNMTVEQAFRTVHNNNSVIAKLRANVQVEGPPENPTVVKIVRLGRDAFNSLSAAQQAALMVLTNLARQREKSERQAHAAVVDPNANLISAIAALSDKVDVLGGSKHNSKVENDGLRQDTMATGLSAHMSGNSFSDAILRARTDADPGNCFVAQISNLDNSYGQPARGHGYFDTGCNAGGGLTPVLENLINIRPATTKIKSCHGDVETPNVVGDMAIVIKGDDGRRIDLLLHDVAHLPGAAATLFSVSHLVELGATVNIDTNGLVLFHDGATIHVPPSNGLYPVEYELATGVECEHSVSLMASVGLWHDRFMHSGNKLINDMHKNGVVNGLLFDRPPPLAPGGKRRQQPRVPPCTVCKLVKTQRRSHPAARRDPEDEAMEPGHTAHTDLKQLKVRSFDGKIYVVLFVDVFTRYLFLRCVPDKTAATVANALSEYISFMSSHDWPVRRVVSDRGSEYDSQERSLNDSIFTSVCRSNGVLHIKTPVDTPSLNGLAERTIRTASTAASAALCAAGLHPKYWSLAFAHYGAVHNMITHRPLGDKVTPHLLVTGNKPDVSKLRVFGCDAYVMRTHDDDAKLPGIQKGRIGIYVGQGTEYMGYRILNPADGSISTTVDVTFNEDLSQRRSQLLHFDAVRARCAGSGTRDDFIATSKDDFDVLQHDARVRGVFADNLADGPADLLHVDKGEKHDVAEDRGPAATLVNEPLAADYQLQDAEHHDRGHDQTEDLHAIHDQPRRQPKRPVRCEPPGKHVRCTIEDNDFIKFAFDNDLAIQISSVNPKQKSSASHGRYAATQTATSLSEYMSLHLAIGTPQSKAKLDFKNDYAHGWVTFPSHEPNDSEHYVHAVTLAAMVIDHESAALAAATARERLIDSISPRQPELGADDITNSNSHGVTEPPLAAVDPNRLNIAITSSFLHEVTDEVERQVRCSHAFAAKQMKRVLLTDPISLVQHIEPMSYKEAVGSSDCTRWRSSMEKEIATINDNHTWELVPMDQCPVRPIGCKWVYRIKLNSDGTIAKFKSRIVAKGFSEVLGQHYQADEVYSPVCSYDTLRVMLSVATQRAWRLYQADIVGAYLQSVLPTPTWMRQPEGFEVLDEQGRPFVCKLRKGLYGTKSGGYHWHRTFDEYVRSIGFVQATGDVCLYLLADHSFGAPDNAEIMLCVYVDDLSIATSTTDAYNWFISTLSRRFPINSDETGALDWMLSMSVKYDIDAGTIKLTQTVAIERLYMVLGMTDEIRPPVLVPMVDRLVRVPQREVEKSEFDFLSILGSVLHINCLTRPDISFAVSNLTRHASCPGHAHVRALKHLVRYLYDTRHIGVTYSRGQGGCEPGLFQGGVHPNTTPDNHMVAFADSDYAMDVTRRSTSGLVIMLNNGPVVWSSRLQKSTAQSTAEAEVIAAADAAKEAVHLGLMLKEMGARDDGAVVIFEDNAACIAQGQQLRNRRAAKHYEVRLRFLQELIVGKIIKFIYCPTKDQLADSFTKPLESALFLKHRQRMLGV